VTVVSRMPSDGEHVERMGGKPWCRRSASARGTGGGRNSRRSAGNFRRSFGRSRSA
jgi:hypothetical protein